MPGQRLLAIARLWLDEGAVQRVLEPLVADWQREQAVAPPRLRWLVWTHALLAFASSVVRVSARAILRELAVPPSVRDVIVLSSAAAGTIAVIFTLSALGGRESPHNPAIVGSVVLVALAPLIWHRVGVTAPRPLPLFLKCATIGVIVTAMIDGGHAVVVMLPIVLMLAASHLPGPPPSTLARRWVLVFGPLGLLIVMNPVLDLGSWPRIWRDVLHMAWGCWSVVACSLDASRDRSRPEVNA